MGSHVVLCWFLSFFRYVVSCDQVSSDFSLNCFYEFLINSCSFSMILLIVSIMNFVMKYNHLNIKVSVYYFSCFYNT